MPMNRGKRGLLGYEDYMPQIDPNEQAAVDEYASKPEQKGLLGFWQGGDKFTARDGIAGLLAAVGDAFAREGGGEGGAVEMLTGGRAKAFAEAKKAAQQEQLIQAGINAGRTRDQMNLITGGAANFGDFKAPEEPEFIRNTNAFYALPEDQQQRVLSYQDMMNPRYTNTAAGTQFIPRTSVPSGVQPMTDEEIRQMGLNPGGPTARPSGRFR